MLKRKFNKQRGVGIKISTLSLSLIVAAGILSGCSTKPASTATTSTTSTTSAKPAVELLNVSYDPTRELYEEYNVAFSKYWKEKNAQDVTIKQSHGGSGSQAKSVLDGLEADVVTLALSGDINSINGKGELIDPKWQTKLAYNSTPG